MPFNPNRRPSMTKSPKKIDSDGDDLWSLLWSRGSNCFHIEELLDTCAKGRRFLHLNQRNDYLLIGVGTFDQMNALADYRTNRPDHT